MTLRVATFNGKSKAEGLHLAWDPAERTFFVEELGRSINCSSVEELVWAGNLTVTDQAGLDAALESFTMPPSREEAEEAAESLRGSGDPFTGGSRRLGQMLLIVAMVTLVLGFTGGMVARGMLQPAPPAPEPVAQPEAPAKPVPAAQYAPESAAAAVSSYYGALSRKDYEAAASLLRPGSSGGDGVAGRMKDAKMEASMPSSATAGDLAGAVDASEDPDTAYYDLTPLLDGKVSVSTLAGSRTAPEAWVTWDKEADTYAVVDRLVPWTAGRPKSDEYVSKSGSTVVRVRSSSIYRSPWAAYLRLDYRDNGSAQKVPIVLPSAKETGKGGVTVSWVSANTTWQDPHAMYAGAYVLPGSPDPSQASPLATAGFRLPLTATRQDRNVMPVIVLP